MEYTFQAVKNIIFHFGETYFIYVNNFFRIFTNCTSAKDIHGQCPRGPLDLQNFINNCIARYV